MKFKLAFLGVSIIGACGPVESEVEGPTVSREASIAPPRIAHWVTSDATQWVLWSRSVDDQVEGEVVYEVCMEDAHCDFTQANHVELAEVQPVRIRAVTADGRESAWVELLGSLPDPFMVLPPAQVEEDGLGTLALALAAAPVQVAAPVYGSYLELAAPTNCPSQAGRWGACQHETGFHVGNSRWAWDWNLNWIGAGPNMDRNVEFSAVDFGTVRAAGGGNYNTIQIEHFTGGAYWYHSEYLHNASVSVRVGDRVSPMTMLGRIGNAGVEDGNHHLHLRLAQRNAAGTLVSFDARFRANGAGILFNHAAPVVVRVGQGLQLSASGTRSHGTIAGPMQATNLTDAAANPQTWWTSANRNVARVDGNGRVTGVARGNTTITLRWSTATATIAVSVQ